MKRRDLDRLLVSLDPTWYYHQQAISRMWLAWEIVTDRLQAINYHLREHAGDFGAKNARWNRRSRTYPGWYWQRHEEAIMPLWERNRLYQDHWGRCLYGTPQSLRKSASRRSKLNQLILYQEALRRGHDPEEAKTPAEWLSYSGNIRLDPRPLAQLNPNALYKIAEVAEHYPKPRQSIRATLYTLALTFPATGDVELDAREPGWLGSRWQEAGSQKRERLNQPWDFLLPGTGT